MLVVGLKEVTVISCQLLVIQMAVKHQGVKEHGFKEQLSRPKERRGGWSSSTMASKKNAPR
jgi:hypothetical protein